MLTAITGEIDIFVRRTECQNSHVILDEIVPEVCAQGKIENLLDCRHISNSRNEYQITLDLYLED